MASSKGKTHKYAVIISWSEDPGDEVFVADVPELPGCTAHGDTHEEALENAQEAIAFWLETCDEDGDPRPVPGAISQIMRSEYVDLKSLKIEEPRPDIVRAQVDFLCQFSHHNDSTVIRSKYD